MSTQPKPYLTPEQYLAIERAAERKSEYFNGEMFAMSGVSFNHSTVTFNLTVLLGGQLRGGRCRAASSDLRVQADARGPYFYPDIVVYRGKPQSLDSHNDTLTDASVVIEVLSRSTERYDRAFKFEHYQKLPSLKDYLLIAQSRVRVEQRSRQADGSWHVQEATDPEAVIHLPSINCSFRVSDIYENVEFEKVEF